MNTLTEADIEQLQKSNRSIELIQRQYEFIIRGTEIEREIEAATLGNGIQKLSLEEEKTALDLFYRALESRNWMKFVPASGAASRMFAPFFAYQKAKSTSGFSLEAYLNAEEGRVLNKALTQLKKLPFYTSAYAKIIQDGSVSIATEADFFDAFIELVIKESGLDYPKRPKALIPFFVDEQGVEWTAFEAQLIEAVELGDQYKALPIHLTIDKENRAAFEAAEAAFRSKRTQDLNKKFKIEYSYHHRLTDTPYLDSQNNWIRDHEGKIAFRKGGHGALLENLNRLDADCIWIKNIDNILLSEENVEGERWMRILGGQLILIQNQLFQYLKNLESLKSEADFEEIIEFIQNHFDPNYELKNSGKMPHQILFDYLYRPLRICGMIPMEGAKGGGPFWKKDARGKSLQIIEGVELNSDKESHQIALDQSTHFNPVMMVCGITNHRGDKFSLYDFRDDKRFMVSEKTEGSATIKILEWPGLWNGGMAAWNTLFIEIPSETFHPVKTIVDLIRD